MVAAATNWRLAGPEFINAGYVTLVPGARED